MYFRVIIPTYDRNIEESVRSVLTQTFKDFILVVSHDDAAAVIKAEKDMIANRMDVYVQGRRFNGGNRNVAMSFEKKAKYTLFLDDDDIFIHQELFQRLHDFIESHNCPDLIRLPYQKKYVNDDRIITKGYKGEDNIEAITRSPRVAPWTKCIKTELLVDFPENTLFEDVAQHIKQCDIVKTTAIFPEPFVQWRIHDGQASKSNSLKWRSSRWRMISDLMDLELTNKYAKDFRDKKLLQSQREIVKDWRAEHGD